MAKAGPGDNIQQSFEAYVFTGWRPINSIKAHKTWLECDTINCRKKLTENYQFSLAERN